MEQVSGLYNPDFVGGQFHWWIGQVANSKSWRDNQPKKHVVWQDSIAGNVYSTDSRRRYYHFTTFAKAQKFIYYWVVDYIELYGAPPVRTINLNARGFEKLPKKIDNFDTGR